MSKELLNACSTGDLRLVTKLLRRDPSLLNKRCGEEGWFPLFVACHTGHEGTARLLLEKGAAVNLANNSGVVPLLLACQQGHEGAALLLLKKGAAIDLATKAGNTSGTLEWDT